MLRKNCLGFAPLAILAVLFLVTSLVTVTAVTNNPVKKQLIKTFAWIPEGFDNPEKDTNRLERLGSREKEEGAPATTTGQVTALTGGIDGRGTPAGGYTIDQIINSGIPGDPNNPPAALNRTGYDCRLGGCAPGVGDDKVDVSGFYKAPNGNYYPVAQSAGGPSGTDLAYIARNLADPNAAKQAADAAVGLISPVVQPAAPATAPVVQQPQAVPQALVDSSGQPLVGPGSVQPRLETVVLRTSDDFAIARQYAEYSKDSNGKLTFLRYISTREYTSYELERTDSGFVRVQSTNIIRDDNNKIIGTIIKRIEPQVGEESKITITTGIPDVRTYRELSHDQAQSTQPLGEPTNRVSQTVVSPYSRPGFNLLYPSTYNRSYNDDGKKYNTIKCGGGNECASGYCGSGGACSDPNFSPVRPTVPESTSSERPAFNIFYPSTWNRSYNESGKKYNTIKCGGGSECASGYCGGGICANRPAVAVPVTPIEQPAASRITITPGTQVRVYNQPVGLTTRNEDQACLRGTCSGQKMFKLYQFYRDTPGWWNNQGTLEFTPGHFLGMMLHAEATGDSPDTLAKILEATSNQLWGGDPSEVPYCSTDDCQGGAGIYNFLAKYVEASWHRYNSYFTGSDNELAGLKLKNNYNNNFEASGFTLDQIAKLTFYDPFTKDKGPNVPSQWGNLNGDDTIRVFANVAATGDTEPCGLYYKSNGDEVIYTLGQLTAHTNGWCN